MRTAIVCTSFALVAFSTAATAADRTIAEGVAERMTQEAIAAGAAGDINLRQDLLNQAVNVAPEFAPARWAQGQMETGGQWQSITEVQSQASTDERRERYQERREAAENTPAAHLELARWCRRNGLADEARFHWLNVLAVDPQNREALAALDRVWVDGELVASQEAEEIKQQRTQQRKVDRKWAARIAGWERAVAAGGDEASRAIAELEAEVDDSAIRSFEKLAAGRRGATSAEIERHAELCKAFARAMGELPCYEASESLVRLAVLAPDESLRTVATTELRDRPLYEYVPLLIEGLQPMVESNFSLNVSPSGHVHYDHEFFVEGAEGAQESEVARTGGAIVSFGPRQSRQSIQQGLASARAVAAGHLRQFQTEATRREQQVAAVNQSRTVLNERIVAVLEEVTGESYGNDPQAWWEYWDEENGYASNPSASPARYRVSTSHVRQLYVPSQQASYPSGGPPSGTTGQLERTPTPTPERRRAPFAGARSYECFAAGTLVWTKTGRQAIETLEVGDLVLSMDVETGERCFRPVLATTRRPPSPLMRISTSSHYDVVATAGHPFWVEGQGWRMAKELTASDRLLSAEGAPLEIRAVADADIEAESYNLVVEDHNNYFVGNDGLLSHDNTRRRPELARAGLW